VSIIEKEIQVENKLPVIGITMGDAAGIGAEITLKALADEKLREICQPLIIGDRAFLRKTSDDLNLNLDFVEAFGEKPPEIEQIAVCDLKNLSGEIPIGIDAAVTGKASAEYVETAIELWRERKIDAISTAPISKKAISLGGYNYPGHTEFLAELTGTKEFAMSFFAEDLRVVLLSTHVSLRDAIEIVKKEKLVDLIRFTDRSLSKLLNKKVKIAVAGLNPHASEFGMFGDEEEREIIPAIVECREEYGLDVAGAYSPDTIFFARF
jgi:4-hydroxythreonine-4-phosphate dehydrogenase